MSNPAEGFLKYYEENLVDFNFSVYFSCQFDSKTPVKYKVELDSSISTIAINLSNSILKNLSMNDHFLKAIEGINATMIDFSKFYQLIKSAITYEPSENCIAQLIMLLHMSKCGFDLYDFEDFFINIDSIKICAQIDLDSDKYKLITTELSPEIPKMLNNKLIKEISIDCVRKILNELKFTTINFDFDKLKLVYFTSNMIGINGYAGVDRIYLSIRELRKLFMKLSNKHSNSQKLVILKLFHAGLILHEMTHVILSHIVNDVNASTPDIMKQSNNTHEIEEAGYLAEIKLFGGVIDWIASSKHENFNINYCMEYMAKLESDEAGLFDINQANVITEKEKPILMGFNICKVHKTVLYF